MRKLILTTAAVAGAIAGAVIVTLWLLSEYDNIGIRIMLLPQIFIPIAVIIIYAIAATVIWCLRKVQEKKYKAPLLVILLPSIALLFIYVYQELRPTIIFHTYQESVYLGKVSTITGGIDKLFTHNHKVKYRLPHIWKWSEDDEVGIFTKQYDDLFKKEDITFWKLDIFFDENGRYASHHITEYPCVLGKRLGYSVRCVADNP